jgi:hypothetical protein
MALIYSIDSSAGILTLTLTGVITLQDFVDYFEILDRDARFGNHLQRLVIAEAVTSYPGRADLQTIAARLKARLATNRSRIAIVGADPLDRGMLSMMLGQGGMSGSYELFEDTDTARAWLQEDRP